MVLTIDAWFAPADENGRVHRELIGPRLELLSGIHQGFAVNIEAQHRSDETMLTRLLPQSGCFLGMGWNERIAGSKRHDEGHDNIFNPNSSLNVLSSRNPVHINRHETPFSFKSRDGVWMGDISRAGRRLDPTIFQVVCYPYVCAQHWG